MNNTRPTLAFFFELNGSLENWDSVGFLSREIILYNRLAKEYFGKIYFFTYGDQTDLKYKHLLEPNIIIIPLKKRPKSFLRAFLSELTLPLLRYPILKGCDIIKTNQNSGSIAAAITKILFPKKILIVRSGYIGSELAKREGLSIIVKVYYFISEHLSYALADKVLIPTQENTDILIKKYPFLKKKIVTHNNYIDTDLFRRDPAAEKKYDIIYVGRMNRDKNHRAILDMAKNTSLRILFIGDGPEKEHCVASAKQSSIFLTHLPSVSNNMLPVYYNQSRICVFPSLHEGNPKSLLEAMACEIPVIGFDVPGVKTIIQNEKNGILCHMEDLKDGSLSLLSDNSQRENLGKKARETVLEEFSLEKILKQETLIYNSFFNL